ncbi:TIGR04283 family arsenosugar biosynthesis glycosyltransferase [Chloroflexota bacterium]
MKISVVIPTLNEEATLHSCISNIKEVDPEIEIIVADGGSIDDTVRIAQVMGVRLCYSKRGRGIQCNTGADIATGDVLVFLHADTRLPDGAFQKLLEIFSDDRVQCGTFRISFDFDHWFLRFLSFISRFDLGIFRFGDQCLVARKSFFESIYGFPEWRLFEDFELVRRARKKTRIWRFPMTVTASARRFIQNGIFRQQAINVGYTVLFLLGTSPEKLADKYEQGKRNYQDNSSIVMLMRYPRPGLTKTRLAVTLGDVNATEFYRICATHLAKEIGKLPGSVHREIWYSEGTDQEMVDWLGSELSYMPQPNGDLGTRLISALDHSFRQGINRTIAVASDIPELTSDILTHALTMLEKADMVIGPTFDGGYYLIGMKKLRRSLFQDISWSTGKVYTQTIDIARKLGLSFHILPKLHDIDTGEDLLTWFTGSHRNSNIDHFVEKLKLEGESNEKL